MQVLNAAFNMGLAGEILDLNVKNSYASPELLVF